MRLTCALCGKEIQPDEIHRCPRLTITGPARRFNWLGWNVLFWAGLAVILLGGTIGGCVSNWWWPQ